MLPVSLPSDHAIEYLRAIKPGMLSRSYEGDQDWVHEYHPVTMAPLLSRRSLVHQFSWSIPSPEAIASIARFSKSIVEVGCGTGYWASLLQSIGCDVICYDAHPPSTGVNEYGHCREYTEIRSGSCMAASDHPDRSLMLSWPPYEDPMAHDTLRAYLNAGGQSLVYIGESWGGCCGNDTFFNLINATMRLVSTIDLPQWYGLHDAVFLYQRQHLTSAIDIENARRRLSAPR